MKGSSTGIVVLVAVVLILGLMYISMNNSLVSLRTDVDEKQAILQSAYQERADLIPNLVATVQGAAQHENNIIETITSSRQALQSAIQSGDVSEMEQLNSELTKSINVLLEAYPEVTATQNFVALQDQLEGQENRIRIARNNYSSAVAEYNRNIRSFPLSLIANSKGYRPIDYYQATASNAESAPTVNFN